MTTELDIATGGYTEIVPARPKAGTAAAAMDMLREHAEMMSMAYDLANSMVGTTMVPKVYQPKSETDKDREKAAQNATAAILYGLELGLNPIQSLQQVFSVHGSPAIYARTMVALLKAKGYKFRTVESGPESVTVEGWLPGEEPETSTWDIERATQAGFVPTIDPETSKYKTKKFNGQNGSYEKLIGNEKYLTQPEEMLWAKAASTVCRRLAPDVLLGIGRTVEDLESETEPDPEPVRVRSERVTAAEILEQAAEPDAPKVKEWQAPAEDKSGSTDVVSQPEPENPESDSGEPETRSAGGATEEQIKALGAALRADGLRTRKQQLAHLGEQFGRSIADPIELTEDECVSLTRHLEGEAAKRNEPGDGGQQTLDADGGAQ